MGIEDQLTELREQTAAILREVRQLRAERQHQGGRWATRAEAARHLAVGLDAVDGMIRRGELRFERLGPPPEERRDRLGRRVDRRRIRIWLSGAPKSRDDIEAAATEARA